MPLLLGTAPNQVPTNADLGTMAFQDEAAVQILGGKASNITLLPVQATTALAPAYVKGAMYFDTTLNKLRIGGATAWETVTSA
jgi:hypothetical protein